MMFCAVIWSTGVDEFREEWGSDFPRVACQGHAHAVMSCARALSMWPLKTSVFQPSKCLKPDSS